VNTVESLRMLAQLVSHSGGTPQVLSSTPRESEFQHEGKKIPSLAPVPKHCAETAQFPGATSPSVRAGPGFGDFLGRGSRDFF